MDFHGRLKGRRLIVTDADLPKPVKQAEIVPDLLAADHLAGLRACWLSLLGGLVSHRESADTGIAIPTVEQPPGEGSDSLTVTNATAIHAVVTKVPLLTTDAHWKRFAGQFRRLDLTGHSVAVLGGERGPFERARRELQSKHKLGRCLRLPPHYEENRTEQKTGIRLQDVDLLVVCTGRIKHADSTQITNLRKTGAITCHVAYVDNDTERHIVRAVLEHFGGDL
jgi:hypothetical protein